MKTRIVFVLMSLSALAMFDRAACGQAILETSNLRLEIGANGDVQSLVAGPSGTEYLHAAPDKLAFVSCNKQSFPASRVTLEGDKLVVGFAKANVTATYRVIKKPEYVAVELLSVEGEPVEGIDLLQIKIKRLPYLGSWINVAYDDGFGICLCAGNIQTRAGMSRGKDYVQLKASAHKEVRLAGTVAVLFGCRDPKDKFLDVMEVVERDFHMPMGARHRRSPVQKYSYLWASPTTKDVDEYIKWARRGGFRMILFSYGSYARGAGHFRWNSRYPGGMADLKKVTDAIRAAGLKLGLHIHYNKAHKSDPYVTPVPDDRLHKVRTFTLAAAIDEKADTLLVNENPEGCTLDDRRRILKAGGELISYEKYTTEPPFRFTGCRRGHLNTKPAAHQAGSQVGLLNVDTWPIFIRFDQDTDIQDETARRIARVFKETGPYDMVYFDGAEDVHQPYWYHVANAQYRVFRHFQPEPPVCEGAAAGHFSWHMLSRSNAHDSVAPDGMKEFCRKAPCRGAPAKALNFSRINFGWLHGFGRSPTNYIGPDVLEYVLSRGAIWDCPFSMTINPAQLKANPRTEDCFDVIKIWEDARINNKLTDAQRQELKNLDREHHLFINEEGRHELVALDEIPVAGGLFKAFGFCRAGRPDDTYLLIWAVGPQADLVLPGVADRLVAMRPFGNRLTVKVEGKNAVLPIAGRTYLVFAGTEVEQVRALVGKRQSGL